MAKTTRKGFPPKTCPECGMTMHPRTKNCPKCGHVFYGNGKQTTAGPASRTAATAAKSASAADVTLVLAAQRLIERAGGLDKAVRLVQEVGKASEKAGF